VPFPRSARGTSRPWPVGYTKFDPGNLRVFVWSKASCVESDSHKGKKSGTFDKGKKTPQAFDRTWGEKDRMLACARGSRVDIIVTRQRGKRGTASSMLSTSPGFESRGEKTQGRRQDLPCFRKEGGGEEA